MKLLLYGLIFTLAVAGSCDKQRVDPGIHTNAKLADALRSSDQRIKVGKNELTLTTYLWRDFMPMAGTDGSSLRCVDKLTDVNKSPISGEITLIQQHVIHGDTVWTAVYDETKNASDYILEGLVQEGPKWGPDIEVDVVCEFEYEGKPYRILARSQKIYKTQ